MLTMTIIQITELAVEFFY